MPPRASKNKKSTNELHPSLLSRPCKPSKLGFKTTDDLPDLENVIGQPRAFRALSIGSELQSPGYNIFILGHSGSGRTTLTKEYLERKASVEPAPDDWCYVNNFENSHVPRAINLPAGRGIDFRKDVQELINRCRSEIPRAFESEEYTKERDRLINELKKKQETEFIHLQKHVEKYKFVIVRSPYGFALVPAIEGKPIKPEELGSLSSQKREKLNDLQSKLGEEVEKVVIRLREIEKSTHEQLRELDTNTILFLIGPMINLLKKKFSQFEQVVDHLNNIQLDIISNASFFRSDENVNIVPESTPTQTDRDWTRRYEINVFVDNTELKGAPVVIENYPSYTNLLGRIEHEAIMGAGRTDFTMIRPGALHKANGGYLLIPARDVIVNPYAWEGLKRALRDGEIRIVELANQLGLISTVTLEPEPIPLRIKVVLVGSPTLFYLLQAYDEDFTKLFKVRAEFGTMMDRTLEAENEYSLFVKSVVVDNQLPAFDRTAVARIIEYSSRLSGDQEKLSTRFGKIADLIRESAYWAEKSGKKVIRRVDVQRAIDDSIYRSNLIEERLQELISNGVLMIDLTDKVVGQVNALSVLQLGDYAFGRPNRVTATTYPGKGNLVDIERQSKLGGSLHTKGVLILSGFLNARYGRGKPLSLGASLTFEQSYEEIQGDSASAAELVALLSSIAEIPLRQDRSITGSVNQHGKIQPIGGVNEKIEGFFASCNANNLTGEQGVIIPAGNQRHLMLNDKVINAVSKGLFHVWTVETIDEIIEIMTDKEVGKMQDDGSYPMGTFNYSVLEKLEEFTKTMQTSTKNLPQVSERENKSNDSG
jgi:lon-related putative ATP-dependent protease